MTFVHAVYSPDAAMMRLWERSLTSVSEPNVETMEVLASPKALDALIAQVATSLEIAVSGGERLGAVRSGSSRELGTSMSSANGLLFARTLTIHADDANLERVQRALSMSLFRDPLLSPQTVSHLFTLEAWAHTVLSGQDGTGESFSHMAAVVNASKQASGKCGLALHLRENAFLWTNKPHASHPYQPVLRHVCQIHDGM